MRCRCPVSEWGVQKQVQKAKGELETEGVRCWMDISGGMQADIFDSMAEGVRNAVCVVCFMTKKYQDSSNCALVRLHGHGPSVQLG
eukprot:COSAG02_NODE_4130_length_5740_cov_3.273888_6_plen_86_part_00